MVHKYISAKTIIDRIYDNYNIQSDDFVSRVSNWTLNCLREIGVKQSYVLDNVILQLHNKKVAIPTDVDRVYGVKINGITAELSFKFETVDKTYYGKNNVVGFDGKVYTHETNILDTYNSVGAITNNEISTFDNTPTPSPTGGIEPWYEDTNVLDGVTSSKFNANYWRHTDIEGYKYKIVAGWIETNSPNGTVELLCGRIPYQYDEILDQLFPLIPDDENLIQYITSEILVHVLMRGYKHALLNLTTNNEFVNPAMAAKKYMALARNSCNSLSPSAKQTLSKLTGRNII